MKKHPVVGGEPRPLKKQRLQEKLSRTWEGLVQTAGGEKKPGNLKTTRGGGGVPRNQLVSQGSNFFLELQKGRGRISQKKGRRDWREKNCPTRGGKTTIGTNFTTTTLKRGP